MNREQLDAYLAQKEREYNLNPGELRSLWGQESNYSTDPNLSGVYLPKHGTAAKGPFQVMPNMHPEFRPGSPLNEQADYAAKFYASGGETPEQRMRRYYGTGQAPKGHPTTDQYVRQVSARMGGYGSQPEQQQEQQMDPNTERQQFQPNYIPVTEPINYEDLPQAPVMKELTGVQKWLANPLTQMGAAIMAASGSPLGAPIGYGVASAASGLGDAQKAENELYELQLKREQARRQLMSEDRKSRMEAMEWNQKQAAMEQLWKLADDYERAGKPIEAAKIRAGVKSGLDTTSGLTPQFLVDENTNKVVQRIYKSDGTFIDTPLGDMKPAGISPGLQGQIALSKGQGGEAGKVGIQTLAGMYDTASNARTALDAVETVKTLMDRGVFTGRGDELTREIAGWYSWATGKDVSKLSNTEQMRLAVQDIVLPSLANMKGASSDKDVAMLKEYAQGTHMTEAALRGAFDRVGAKYGSEIDRFNLQYENYLKAGNKEITGFSPVEKPSGYIQNPNREAKTPAAPAPKAPAAPTPTAAAPKGGGDAGTPVRRKFNPATGRLE